MIEKGLIITGTDADLLSNALSEVKTKAYEESEAQLDDAQALDALVSGFKSFRNASNDGQEEERHNLNFSPLRKRLVLAKIINGKISAGVARHDRAQKVFGANRVARVKLHLTT